MTESDPSLLEPGGALSIYSETVDSAEDTLIGRELAGYRLEALIAAGGMGSVYRASRIDGTFERDVAIKVSPGSGFSRRLREHFVREQSILAGLNHPNIAQLYDAGVTEEGWPFIVMELIEGQPLDEYCRALTPLEIVDLAVDIADAVAFAHARLVVHRDIKPSNVKVGQDGQPKLLDFGIARLLAGGNQETLASRPMSPGYASPEQLLGHDVTTASDVYQLGALVYELCVGKPLRSNDELADTIQRFAHGKTVVDTGELGQLPVELAQIIACCLRVEPGDRFGSMSDLGLDLERYRDGFPVSAHGTSRAYRFRKFVRRNWIASLLLGTTLTLLVASSTWYVASVTAARDTAERETILAEESLQFLLGFFDDMAPENSRSHTITAREVIDKGVGRLRTELTDRPEVRARLMTSLSSLYSDLGENTTAVELARASRGYYLRNHEAMHPDTRQATSNLARALYLAGDYEEAAALYEQLLEVDIEVDGPAHENTLLTRSNLASLYWYLGRMEESARLASEIYFLTRETLGEDHEKTLVRAYNYANSLQTVGKTAESIPLLEENLAIAESAIGETHPYSLALLRGLGSAYQMQQNHEYAKELFLKLIDISTEVFGRDHIDTLLAANSLATNYYEQGEHEKGVHVQRDVIERMARTLGPEHPRTLVARGELTVGLAGIGSYAESYELATDVIGQQTELHGPTHPNTLNTRLYLAEALVLGAEPTARDYVDDLLVVIDAELGSDHLRVAELRKLREQIDNDDIP